MAMVNNNSQGGQHIGLRQRDRQSGTEGWKGRERGGEGDLDVDAAVAADARELPQDYAQRFHQALVPRAAPLRRHKAGGRHTVRPAAAPPSVSQSAPFELAKYD